MNTPAHLIFAAGSFAKPTKPATIWWAMLGGLTPDLSLYLLTAWHRFVLDTSFQTIFRELYYSDTWQQIFAIDNSFILWGILLALALWRRSDIFIAFTAGAMLHLLLDFFLHVGDARQQFWPLTDWVFRSPVSYYDSRYYGDIVKPVEFLLCIGFVIVFWRRFSQWLPRIAMLLLLALEIFPEIIFRLIL